MVRRGDDAATVDEREAQLKAMTSPPAPQVMTAEEIERGKNNLFVRWAGCASLTIQRKHAEALFATIDALCARAESAEADNKALREALSNVLNLSVSDHDDRFPGCKGCDAVIAAKKLLGEPISTPDPSWIGRLTSSSSSSPKETR